MSKENRILAFERPDLMKEWDFEKNVDICAPDEVTIWSKKKVWWKCQKCENEWQATIKSRNKGTGCPICNKKKQVKSKTKSNDQFIKELQQKNCNIEPLEPYVNSATKIMCSCTVCGYSWKVRPNSLLRGYGCPNCAGNKKKSNQDFVNELSQINSNIVPLEEYQGNKTPILCKCKICGNTWKNSPNNLLSKKHKCPYCSRITRSVKRRKTNKEFVQELHTINPNIIPLEEYTTSQRKIKCKCNICGNIWSATPNNLLDKGSHCPQCSHVSTSVIEQIILGSFTITLGKDAVLSRNKKTIGKELDIVIPKLNLAIEFGAWFWHKNRLDKDNEKQRLCREKGIHLITYLEDCPSQVETELIGDFRLFQEEISNESDYKTTLEIIKQICLEYGVTDKLVLQNWETIVKDALNNAQRRTSDDFKELLFKKNPNVVLLEAYTYSKIKIKCKCRVCGHIWKALPTSLLMGHGCPKCARRITGEKKTITNEAFINRLLKINSTIEPLDEYKKGNMEIRCKCTVCGNIWSTKPSNLLQGNGCPKCGKVSSAKKRGKRIRCIETGICYDSISDVLRQTGIHSVNKCTKGYQKTAGGYHWEYV